MGFLPSESFKREQFSIKGHFWVFFGLTLTLPDVTTPSPCDAESTSCTPRPLLSSTPRLEVNHCTSPTPCPSPPPPLGTTVPPHPGGNRCQVTPPPPPPPPGGIDTIANEQITAAYYAEFMTNLLLAVRRPRL